MIRQERNDERMVKWIFNVRPGERNSAEKLGTRLILKSIRTKDCNGLVMLNAWSSKCRKFKVNSSFPRTQPKNTWNEAIRSDLKQRKVNKVKVKDINFRKSFKRNRLSHGKHIKTKIMMIAHTTICQFIGGSEKENF